MQKRVVVLGGVGFIGAHLCLHLLEQGHEVFCVDIRDPGASPLLRHELRHPWLHIIHHNIIQPFNIRCDELYNLAAPSLVHYHATLPVETLKVCIAGSVNALDTARSQQARVVYVSSGEVYASGFNDSLATHPLSHHHILAEGKRAAEIMHHAYRQEYGVDARIARVFNTYGWGAELMDQRVVMKMIVAALQNHDIRINGSGEQLRTFCWVEDVVEGLRKLMETDLNGRMPAFNFAGDCTLSIQELAERIISLAGSRSRIIHTEARSDDTRHPKADLTASKRELDWEPETPLDEGLKRTIEYARQELKERARGAMTWVEMG